MFNPVVLTQTQGKEVDEVEVVSGSCGRDVKVYSVLRIRVDCKHRRGVDGQCRVPPFRMHSYPTLTPCVCA